jgi:hypothetical protein
MGRLHLGMVRGGRNRFDSRCSASRTPSIAILRRWRLVPSPCHEPGMGSIRTGPSFADFGSLEPAPVPVGGGVSIQAPHRLALDLPSALR